MIDTGRRAAGLHYEERGSGEATIVWLPGFGQSTEVFADIVPAFDLSHRSIILDLPGHAASVGVPVDPTVEGFASTVFAALAELEVGEVILVGYSIGAAIARQIAVDHPESVVRLIGVVPWQAGGAGEATEGLDAFAAAHGDVAALEQACVGIATQQPARHGDMPVVMSGVPASIWKGWLLEGTRVNMAHELTKLDLPVDYLLGTKDTVIPLDMALEDIAAIPGGRAVVLSGLGHLCGYEHPEVIVRELRRLLEVQ